MRQYAVTYSYPTSDRYHRGYCSTVVRAISEEFAVLSILDVCPDAKIVRFRAK